MPNGIEEYAKEQFQKELDATIEALEHDSEASPMVFAQIAGACAAHGDTTGALAILDTRSRRQAKASAMVLSILRESQQKRTALSGAQITGISTVVTGIAIGLLKALETVFGGGVAPAATP
jgi:hypothetical protein